jgi:hypothetical protein
MTKTILQAALAARDAALDLDKLSAAVHAARPATVPVAGRVPSWLRSADSHHPAVAAIIASQGTAIPADSRAVPIVVDLPMRTDTAAPTKPVRRVPDVRGLTLRDAVRSLHGAGLRVQLVGGPVPNGTVPAPGAVVAAGTLVRLRYNH